MPNKDFTPGSIFIRSTSLKLHNWKEVGIYIVASYI